MKLTPKDPIIIPAIDGDAVSIDPVDFTIRKNGLLGINDAGKSYAGGWFAEQLMKRGIPITAISPSPNSPWRYLKIPKPGKEGFPVVVVGDNADLPLDPDRMQDIMRAAMQEGINIVFDLHSSGLSEAARRRITTAIVDTMYWENQDYGLRHCFLEEVANYAPQNLHDRVTYGAVERFAREGGNAMVGITMLNPRAESVNKNLLELCSSLFLFQQTGRNSIKNLKKFFDMLDTSDREKIIKSFPRLIKGRAFYWEAIGAEPIEIQFPEKDTEHPNRRALGTDAKIPMERATDVTTFVARMTKALAKKVVVEESPWVAEREKRLIFPPKSGNALENPLQTPLFDAQQKVIELEQKLSKKDEELRNARAQNVALVRQLEVVKDLLLPDYERLQKIFGEVDVVQSSVNGGDASYWQPFLDKLGGGERRVLEVLIERKHLNHHQIRLLAGIGAKRTLSNIITSLVGKGLIRREGKNEVAIKEI